MCRSEAGRGVPRHSYRHLQLSDLFSRALTPAIALLIFQSGIAHGDEKRDSQVQWSSAQLTGKFAGDSFEVKLESRLASAIGSLRWRGKEFVNAHDHGRELQSAVTFDDQRECFNPTEAGSKQDGTTNRSTSILQKINAHESYIDTVEQMAFWLAPGTRSNNCPMGAANTSAVSDIVLTKHTQVAADGIPNAIEQSITYHVPTAFKTANFEPLTIYMPPEFANYWTFDPATGVRAQISAGPGIQDLPIILSTKDGSYAFGAYCTDVHKEGWGKVGYGRRDFTGLKGSPGSATVKMSCVFRVKPVAPGDYRFECASIFGTLKDVEVAMTQLYRKRSHS